MNKEVEYLKEHLYEIYKYKKSMKDLTYDMDIEHLLRTCKALDYSQKEIERLNTNLEVANEDLTRIAQLLDLEEGCTIYDIEDKIKRLNNIIKEVRERVLNENKPLPSAREIIEILDKVNNKTNEVMPVEELEEYEPKNMAEQEYQDWFWRDEE